MSETQQSVKKQRWAIYGFTALLVYLVFAVTRLVSNGIDVSVPRDELAACSLEVREAGASYALEYGTLPPPADNRRFIEMLSGDNPHKIAFLRLESRDLNANGELIDSWGTVVRFTVDSKSKIRILSAGPDKIFGTADDITNL